MTRDRIRTIFLGALVAIAALSATSAPARPATAQGATAQDAKDPYPTMAPIDQYLMDRDAEITLARSAAPDAISKDASRCSS